MKKLFLLAVLPMIFVSCKKKPNSEGCKRCTIYNFSYLNSYYKKVIGDTTLCNSIDEGNYINANSWVNQTTQRQQTVTCN